MNLSGKMQSFVSQFAKTQHEHRVLVQFVKYAIGGTAATVVHVLVFYSSAIALLPALSPNDVVAHFAHVHPTFVSDTMRARNSLYCNGLAFIFSNLTAYLINVYWVFGRGRHNRVLEIVFFYIVSGVSMLVGSALMGLMIHRFGVMTTVAFTSNLLASLSINFALRKHFIFKR